MNCEEVVSGGGFYQKSLLRPVSMPGSGLANLTVSDEKISFLVQKQEVVKEMGAGVEGGGDSLKVGGDGRSPTNALTHFFNELSTGLSAFPTATHRAGAFHNLPLSS